MSQDSEVLLKAVAQTAAETLSQGGGSALILAAQLGLFRDPMGRTDLFPVEGRPNHIGIWERQGHGSQSAFVRSDQLQDQAYRWADVSVIPPKGRQKRVVYLGESAARGSFFDPLYTPGWVLQEIMTRYIPAGVEVVDLAAYDLQGAELLTLLTQVSWLEPDAMVIFAGNNWSARAALMAVADPFRRQCAAASLRTSGVPGLKAFVEEAFLALLEHGLQQLPALVQAMALPTVVVIPEFNLVDWRHETTATAPWLRADQNQRWWQHYEAAQLAIQQGEIEHAATAARIMVELDGGTTSQGLALLGACKKALGLHQEARRYFEQARDARSWDPINLSPRCPAIIQERLRRLAGDMVAVVDLPKVFQDWTGEALPDRRLFLDYCHLTDEGIRVAMAATAEALVRLLGGSPVSRTDVLASPAYVPSAEVKSMAHFAAATHNAHWGQDQEVVLHHCRLAAKLSARTAKVMSLYIDIQGRRVPPFLADKTQAIFEEGGEVLRRFLSRYRQGTTFDELLLNAIVAALEGVGIDVRAYLARMREEEWSITVERPADLTGWEYIPSFGLRGWGPQAAHRFYRAYTPVTRFPVVCRAEHAVTLKLICRRPRRFMQPHRPCRITFNGGDLDAFTLPEKWTTLTFTVPSRLVRRGVNAIEIHWPIGHWAGDAALDWAAKELEAGVDVDLVPAFGEIHTFRAAVSEIKQGPKSS